MGWILSIIVLIIVIACVDEDVAKIIVGILIFCTALFTLKSDFVASYVMKQYEEGAIVKESIIVE